MSFRILFISERILKILPKSRRLLSIEEIVDKLHEPPYCINLAISRLMRQNRIEMETIGNKNCVRTAVQQIPAKEVPDVYDARETGSEKMSAV